MSVHSELGVVEGAEDDLADLPGHGVKDEEEEYKDNMPENLQSSERYTRAEEIVDNLSEALDNLDTVLEYVEDATQ